MSISVDHSHSSIYQEGVYLYSWGKNKNGELGNGTMTDCFYPTPVKQLNGKQITTDTWSYDFDIPRFTGEGRDYIERYLYPDDPNNTTSRKDGNN